MILHSGIVMWTVPSTPVCTLGLGILNFSTQWPLKKHYFLASKSHDKPINNTTKHVEKHTTFTMLSYFLFPVQYVSDSFWIRILSTSMLGILAIFRLFVNVAAWKTDGPKKRDTRLMITHTVYFLSWKMRKFKNQPKHRRQQWQQGKQDLARTHLHSEAVRYRLMDSVNPSGRVGKVRLYRNGGWFWNAIQVNHAVLLRKVGRPHLQTTMWSAWEWQRRRWGDVNLLKIK